MNTIFCKKMLIAFFMGFSCGMPLLLTISVLQAWMKEAGVDLSVIGLMALVGIPYTLKFLWAPVFDRFTLCFLGRRRGWLLVSQLLLMIAIVGLGFSNPQHPVWISLAAFWVTFFSASQDIVVDAYRREDLTDSELGLGSSLYINGYRLGMLLASGGALIMADFISFQMVYIIMAGCMLPGILTTLLAREPEMPYGCPKTLQQAVVDPLIEYFQRNDAIWILTFILCYKLGDTMATAMTTPFYLEIGFTKTEIGSIVKLFGFWATVFGTLTGGIMMIRIGIHRSLWIFGFFQAFSTACFAVLAQLGHSVPTLAWVVVFENLSTGMGTSAYSAFMASITNKKFTATQYALLSSLMGVPRVLASAPTGWMVKQLGWQNFFIMCSLIAIPGMLLLLKFATWQEKPPSGTFSKCD
ncbi:MAG: AmpG family muropeptide MFS transporter [Desulfobacterales bacterium]|nr:AmpG family muropeptide MFS transporter [Desulfobacterales bacterium]